MPKLNKLGSADSLKNLPSLVRGEDLDGTAIPKRLHVGIQPLKKSAINSNSDVILCHFGAVLRLAFGLRHGLACARSAPWALDGKQVGSLVVVGVFHAWPFP
uniref:hypothetical protein n=1 Tax=Aeromonas hydrophila TaxID=644 RepID=UPI00155D9A28|nr:hypothetical protein [Aeromonas hydrophila]